jgi:DNA-binding MarR family transcriptional regulator
VPEPATSDVGATPRERRLREVGLAFRGAYHSLRRLRARDTHIGPGGLGNAQYELLARLREDGPLPAGALANALGVTPATVSQMVDGLVEGGYAERVRGATDRRVVEVKLTRRGRSWVAARSSAWRERWSQALAEFDGEELETAAAVLDRIARIFHEVAAEEPVQRSGGSGSRRPPN